MKSKKTSRWERFMSDKIDMHLYFKNDEYEIFKQRAAEHGKPLATFLKDSALGKKSIPKTEAHLIAELRRQGGLQLELTKQLSEPNKTAAEVEELVAEMKKLYRQISVTVLTIKDRYSNDNRED